MAIAAACRVASIISAAAHRVVLPDDVDETHQGNDHDPGRAHDHDHLGTRDGCVRGLI